MPSCAISHNFCYKNNECTTLAYTTTKIQNLKMSCTGSCITPNDEIFCFFLIEKLQLLKEKIKKSGYEVMSQYPASFSKIDENGVAILKNLELFGSRLFDNCWNAILNFHEKNMREHSKRSSTVETELGKH